MYKSSHGEDVTELPRDQNCHEYYINVVLSLSTFQVLMSYQCSLLSSDTISASLRTDPWSIERYQHSKCRK